MWFNIDLGLCISMVNQNKFGSSAGFVNTLLVKMNKNPAHPPKLHYAELLKQKYV